MNICTRCILPDTFPGITFNKEGVCNHCQKFQGVEILQGHREEFEEKFLGLIDIYRDKGAYDCLVAYSGGKDSTYTLKLLKDRYRLRVLALTIDNGFVSDQAFKNMCSVTEKLGVDHMVFKPKFDLMRKIFRGAVDKDIYSKKTLERASTICTSCIGIVKFITLKTALEKRIMLIGFGWSPGQAPVQSSVIRTNPALIKATQAAIQGPLSRLAGDEVNAYFLEERHFAHAEGFPYYVHPLAFLRYDEEEIVRDISQLGWHMPEDTDSNSTNCLLNAFANDVHIRRFNFHPYVWEIANMVRDGVMNREEGCKKIYGVQSPHLLRTAKERLGLSEI